MFTGRGPDKLDKQYRDGQALVNPLQFRESLNHFQKDTPFWNSPRAINCELSQSFKLMTIFPAELPDLKKLSKKILRK